MRDCEHLQGALHGARGTRAVVSENGERGRASSGSPRPPAPLSPSSPLPALRSSSCPTTCVTAPLCSGALARLPRPNGADPQPSHRPSSSQKPLAAPPPRLDPLAPPRPWPQEQVRLYLPNAALRTPARPLQRARELTLALSPPTAPADLRHGFGRCVAHLPDAVLGPSQERPRRHQGPPLQGEPRREPLSRPVARVTHLARLESPPVVDPPHAGAQEEARGSSSMEEQAAGTGAWSGSESTAGAASTRGVRRRRPASTSALTPCCALLQIIDMSTSKTGKHGHAKVHLIATDVRPPLPRSTVSLPPQSTSG